MELTIKYEVRFVRVRMSLNGCVLLIDFVVPALIW
jgi:hypothetical protein